MNAMMSRRHVLLGTVPTALMLSGCGAGGSASVPQWAAAISAIGQTAGLILPELQAAGLSGAAAAQATSIIGRITAAASAISAASTATQGQSTLVQIEGDINALAPLVLPFVALIPGGGTIGLIIAALPVIELGVNLAVSLLTPQAKALVATVAPAPAAAAPAPGQRLPTPIAPVPLPADQAVALLIARAQGT